jgi:hypothetical protein
VQDGRTESKQVEVVARLSDWIEEMGEPRGGTGTSPLSIDELKWLMQKGSWSIPILLVRNRIIEKKVFKILNR